MNAYARQAFNAYQKTDVFTVSPGELVAKLLIGAESALKKGLDAMERGDHATKGEQFSRAIAILGELRASLDFERGGDIAANLDAIYDYCIREILFGNLRKDRVRVEKVLDILKPVVDGWMAIKDTKAEEIRKAEKEYEASTAQRNDKMSGIRPEGAETLAPEEAEPQRIQAAL